MKIKVILVGAYAPNHSPTNNTIGIGYRKPDGSDGHLIQFRLFLEDYMKKSSKFFHGYNYIDSKEYDCTIAHYIHKDSL